MEITKLGFVDFDKITHKGLLVRVRIDKTEPFNNKYLAETLIFSQSVIKENVYFSVLKFSYFRPLKVKEYNYNFDFQIFDAEKFKDEILKSFILREQPCIFPWAIEPWVLWNKPVIGLINKLETTISEDHARLMVVPITNPEILIILARAEGILSVQNYEDPAAKQLRIDMGRRLASMINQHRIALTRTLTADFISFTGGS